MLSFEDVNVLGQLINTTFGYSSTEEKKYQIPAGRSIKSHISGETGEDRLIVKFTTVVNLHGDERQMLDSNHPGARRVKEESLKLTKDYIAALKKEFKEATGKTLRLVEESTNDSIELVNYNIFNPNRTVYYRRNSTFAIKS
jgi:hypothetical protein|tara:strand:- start:534 stop:959 length:426 start_codon:yes stop_codon:yes gene_type:complete